MIALYEDIGGTAKQDLSIVIWNDAKFFCPNCQNYVKSNIVDCQLRCSVCDQKLLQMSLPPAPDSTTQE
jgi:Zn finger protein HypA/HybF involved in hydrogenase expression